LGKFTQKNITPKHACIRITSPIKNENLGKFLEKNLSTIGKSVAKLDVAKQMHVHFYVILITQ